MPSNPPVPNREPSSPGVQPPRIRMWTELGGTRDPGHIESQAGRLEIDGVETLVTFGHSDPSNPVAAHIIWMHPPEDHAAWLAAGIGNWPTYAEYSARIFAAASAMSQHGYTVEIRHQTVAEFLGRMRRSNPHRDALLTACDREPASPGILPAADAGHCVLGQLANGLWQVQSPSRQHFLGNNGQWFNLHTTSDYLTITLAEYGYFTSKQAATDALDKAPPAPPPFPEGQPEASVFRENKSPQ